MNPSLRAAIDRARSFSMPKDNIERAVKKGTGELGGAQMEEIYYEGIGPYNTQVIVKCVTDNRNRSASVVRHAFSKNGGSLGAVMWNFEQMGVILIDKTEIKGKNLDNLELEFIDHGAFDIEQAEEGWTVYTRLNDFQTMQTYLKDLQIKCESAELEYVAKEKISLSEDEQEKFDRFLEELDDNEDVTAIYNNLAN
jgi:YebC/PmpR family DNA-binding regulatory protein